MAVREGHAIWENEKVKRMIGNDIEFDMEIDCHYVF